MGKKNQQPFLVKYVHKSRYKDQEQTLAQEETLDLILILQERSMLDNGVSSNEEHDLYLY